VNSRCGEREIAAFSVPIDSNTNMTYTCPNINE
jgi:hypothetical protein